jgi:hypothetical protein
MGRINHLLVMLEPLGKMRQVPSKERETWEACCPAHADTNPSLRVTETHDDRILLHCWAGCGARDILDALGLDWDILFPPKIDKITKMESVFGPRPARKRTLDDHLLAVASADRKNGRRLTEAEKRQEFEAFKRIQARGY